MPTISKLIQDLKGKDPQKQLAAAERFAQLGAEARGAAVALVRAAGIDHEAVREHVAAALEEMGSPSASDLQALAELLPSEHPDIGYWAATLIGRLGTEAAPAVSALVSTLEQSTAAHVRQRCAWALGNIGAAARSALPVLNQAAANGDARLARIAQEAIRQINS